MSFIQIKPKIILLEQCEYLVNWKLGGIERDFKEKNEIFQPIIQMYKYTNAKVFANDDKNVCEKLNIHRFQYIEKYREDYLEQTLKTNSEFSQLLKESSDNDSIVIGGAHIFPHKKTKEFSKYGKGEEVEFHGCVQTPIQFIIDYNQMFNRNISIILDPRITLTGNPIQYDESTLYKVVSGNKPINDFGKYYIKPLN